MLTQPEYYKIIIIKLLLYIFLDEILKVLKLHE